MAKRIRTTVTVREDDPVPRSRRKKKQSSVLVIIILVLIGLFVLSRTRQGGGFRPQPVSAPSR
jgi:hypothetical protein